jgi:hypothetical protein
MFPINPQILNDLMQVGGQYLLPISALLRALYSGMRGKLPEGFLQIGAAAVFAGITAGVNGQAVDLPGIVRQVLSNAVFTAGLLAFIMVFLLRAPNFGLLVDALIGGIIGGMIWLFTVYVLLEVWPVWLLLLIVPGCAFGFVLLRFALRQIVRVMRIATYLLVLGLLLALGAGGFLLYRSLTGAA